MEQPGTAGQPDHANRQTRGKEWIHEFNLEKYNASVILASTAVLLKRPWLFFLEVGPGESGL